MVAAQRQALAGGTGRLATTRRSARLLAGDFNATVDHAHFRRLLRLGYVDAAGQTGNGLTPTWGPERAAAILTLDHVLADARCAVLQTSVHALAGSDHRAVFAALRLPG